MHNFNIGDQVLVINSIYNPELIGHVGTIEHCADQFAGYDKNGCYISGKYVIVDLPDAINRYGTTLWYFIPDHLIKITPDETSGINTEAETFVL